ncbi:31970_t:CDS:2 [Gigaspora margarita]|uniref:31970_t:CDS:1 n=1 Tax=Gigaspora margarita TaxID=4874 RepID=A0ABN7UF05_GIGMA|nr:31970_t:CDS:2 [Gigaspora margarita]
MSRSEQLCYGCCDSFTSGNPGEFPNGNHLLEHQSAKIWDAVKLWREALDGINRIQVVGEIVYLNVLMLDGAGVPRLLKRALEQAVTNPPRNIRSSSAVSSPSREEQERKRQEPARIIRIYALAAAGGFFHLILA